MQLPTVEVSTVWNHTTAVRLGHSAVCVDHVLVVEATCDSRKVWLAWRGNDERTVPRECRNASGAPREARYTKLSKRVPRRALRGLQEENFERTSARPVPMRPRKAKEKRTRGAVSRDLQGTL